MLQSEIFEHKGMVMSNQIELYEKKYPQNWVVMQNRMRQVFYEMTLDEKRILLLASPTARLIDATQDDAIEVTAKEFASNCGIEVDSAYSQMRDASNTIMSRMFSYKNERGKKVNVQWVIRSIYEDGYIALWFTKEVLEMLKLFDENNPFTKYKKNEVLKLKGEYSIDLYHLAKKYEKMGSWVMPLDEIREEFSLTKSYERINNLKNRVVDPSVKEITEKTDIEITYENVKRGRAVVALKFKIKAKPKMLIDIKQDQDTRDIPPLTDKQIDLFLNDFTNDPSISGSAPMGMTMNAFKSYVRTNLKNKDYVQKHKKVLMKVGYKFR